MIVRRSTTRISALSTPLLLGGLMSASLGHGGSAVPQMSVAASHANTIQVQPLADRTGYVALNEGAAAGDRVVADVSPVVASTMVVGDVDEVVVQPATFIHHMAIVRPATFIHHMVIGSDSAGVSRQPLVITA